MAKRKRRAPHRKCGAGIELRMEFAMANTARRKGERKFAQGRRAPGRIGIQVMLSMPGSKKTKSRRVGGRTRRTL